MPFICVNTPAKMTDEQKVTLKSRLGANVSLIEGKVEARLMIKIADNCDMYFAGQANDQIAFVEIRLFKTAPFDQKQKFVESIYEALSDILSVDKTQCFISITEHLEWGSGGTLVK